MTGVEPIVSEFEHTDQYSVLNLRTVSMHQAKCDPNSSNCYISKRGFLPSLKEFRLSERELCFLDTHLLIKSAFECSAARFGEKVLLRSLWTILRFAIAI